MEANGDSRAGDGNGARYNYNSQTDVVETTGAIYKGINMKEKLEGNYVEMAIIRIVNPKRQDFPTCKNFTNYGECEKTSVPLNLTKTAETKHIFQIGSIDSKLKTKVECKLNYENGYIDVNLVKPDGVEIEEFAVGSFYLLRASDEDNFTSWHEVLKFVLQGQ